MKNPKDVPLPVTVVSALLGLMLPLSPAHAQNPPADVINAARESCLRDAGAKGFQLKNVVEAGPSDKPDKEVKVVLNLTRNGQLFKQTCYYSKTSDVPVGEEPNTGTMSAPTAEAPTAPDAPNANTGTMSAPTAEVPNAPDAPNANTGTMSAPTAEVPNAPNWSNLWWWLVPLLLGLGLWWWVRNRDAGITRTDTTGDYGRTKATGDYGRTGTTGEYGRTGTTGEYGRTGTMGEYGGYAERREAIVRSNARNINIRSGPADSYKMTGTLNDGQRVTLSGRYDNNWAELADGGWIPAQYVDSR